MTPGVSITELNAFPQSVVGVATAVPAFIGYTAKAPAALQPVEIRGMAELESFFGGAPEGSSPFNLYDSMVLFYENGGASCFVVSVGDYSAGTIDPARLTAGLDAIAAQSGPTMLVIPELVLVDAASYGAIVQAMLAQCGTLQDRVAILDIHGGADVSTPVELEAAIAAFHTAVGSAHLSFGMAYFPFLRTANRVLPASAAMAGIYTQVDGTRGVWSAPANVSLNGVSTTYKVTDDQQIEMNTPTDGKAVNPLRDFPGRGAVVWGARTLDGNSHDVRYIHVRRTLIYIQQSIRTALVPFRFAANDGNTWSTVVAMTSQYLTEVWSGGGLVGATAADAFRVACGLGSTMTGDDVLNGIMRMQVTLQLTGLAELMELTFEQQMESAV